VTSSREEKVDDDDEDDDYGDRGLSEKEPTTTLT